MTINPDKVKHRAYAVICEANGPVRVAEIADILGVDPHKVGGAVHSLHCDGRITRVRQGQYVAWIPKGYMHIVRQEAE